MPCIPERLGRHLLLTDSPPAAAQGQVGIAIVTINATLSGYAASLGLIRYPQH
jgi:hypothetical protein